MDDELPPSLRGSAPADADSDVPPSLRGSAAPAAPAKPTPGESLTETPVAHPVVGALGEGAQAVHDFASKPFGYPNPPGEILSKALGIPSIAKTLERLSYGERLTTGKGQTAAMKPETADTAMAALPFVGAGAKAAAPAVGRLAQRIPALPDFSIPGSGVLDRATGKTATASAETLRSEATGLAGEKAGAARAAAAPLERELSAAEKAQAQLAGQPAKAAERAGQKALDPAAVTAEKLAVREKAGARRAAAEEAHRRAGLSVEEAKKAAGEAEAMHTDAQAAVDALEKDMLARPGTDKETFGAKLRTAVQALHDKYTGIRGQEVQFGKVIEQAGDAQIVPTKTVQAAIDKHMEGIKNPNLQALLSRVSSLLGKADEAPRGMQAEMNVLAEGAKPAAAGAENLTLRQTQSLKTYLDSIIQTKQFKDAAGSAMAVDAETMNVVRDLKRALVESATSAYPPYREALAKYNTLSRPLDIVERKGALRPVLDADPVSTNFKLTEAEVTGKVIAKARAGNPVFTRLLAESPELKDSARLYFTQDLFGAKGAPTQAALASWLKTNEGPLRQIGLYDEFRSLSAAQKAAQRAVGEAKGAVQEAGKGVVAAKAAEASAGQEATQAAKVSRLSEARLSKALGGVEAPEQIAMRSQQRAGQARQALGEKAARTGRALEDQRRVAERFETFQTEIANAKPAEVGGKIKSMGKRMVDEKLITQGEYAKIIQQANEVDKNYADVAKTRRVLLTIGGILGVGALGSKASHLLPTP